MASYAEARCSSSKRSQTADEETCATRDVLPLRNVAAALAAWRTMLNLTDVTWGNEAYTLQRLPGIT